MVQFKNYIYNLTEISFIEKDNTNGSFLWIGFKKNSEDICILKKVSANNPFQIYFTMEIEAEEIVDSQLNSSYIYLALNDETYIGQRRHITNPITNITNFSIPAGINEAPISLLVNGSYVYFLTPGILSGENAKIIKLNLTGTFIETIDLSTITNASSFTFDGSDFWVTTNTSPAQLVRVYQISGGFWTYTVF